MKMMRNDVPAVAPLELDFVYVDDALIVLNKPAGLLSVPGRGPDKQDCLSTRVQKIYADALVVHRLDMATSGLIIMARGIATQRILNNAFSQRAVHKRYSALVTGRPTATLGVWQVIDLPIFADWLLRPLRTIDWQRGKPSITRWREVHYDRVRNCTHLELEAVTGRSHQLRVHLNAIGHPILGDTLYASECVAALSARLLLHASHLALKHPVTGITMQWSCPAQFSAPTFHP